MKIKNEVSIQSTDMIREMKTSRQCLRKQACRITVLLFLLMIIISWVNEMADLPHIIWHCEPTSVNWGELILETIILCVFCAVLLMISRANLKSQQRIENKLDLFSTTLTQSQDGVLIMDMDMMPSYANPSCYHLLGVSAHELAQLNSIEELGIPFPVAAASELQQFFLEKNNWTAEFLRYEGTDKECIIEARLFPVRDESGIHSAVYFFRDVTQIHYAKRLREKNEKRFRDFSECLPQLALELDHQFRVTFANEQGRRIVRMHNNLTENDPFPDHFIRCFPQAIKKNINEICTHLAKGKDVSGVEISYDTGTERAEFLMYGTPIIKDDVFSGARITLTDVREQHAIRNRLQANEQRLTIANEKKRKFFSIIAHDLRSPFCSIRDSANALKQHVDRNSGAAKKYLTSINLAVDKSLRLIDDLTEWATSKDDEILVNKRPFNVQFIADETVQHFSDRAAQKKINLRSTVSRSHFAVGDTHMIKTVMRNLVDNAIKFTFHGGDIEIYSNHRNERIHICVADTGMGMTPELVQQINQGSTHGPLQGTDKGEQGLGLGLCLCQDFVRQNDGQMVINSVLGEGTSVVVDLPSYQTSNDDSASQAAKKSNILLNSIQPVRINPPLRFLVVEDEKMVQKTLHKYLIPLGVVDVVADGNSAFKAYEQALESGAPYDLITMDIQIPVLDGVKVLEQIRKTEQEKEIDFWENGARVVIITSLRDKKTIMNCYELNCWGYLFKPLRKDELYKKMEQLKLVKRY